MTKIEDRQESTFAVKSSKAALTKSDDIMIHSMKDTDVVSVDLKNAQTGPVAEKAEAQPNQVMVMFGLLRKLIGVKDILALRISLPATLLAPVGNLEYWNYMDRPDIFSTMADPDEPLERMVNVLHWWFSKDLKYISGKLIKPYNSILGETFKCWWDVSQEEMDSTGQASLTASESKETIRVKCLNEQISHHPPVSGFYYTCEQKGVEARGIDHISARFSGTSFKVGPGDQNLGIFVRMLNRDNEEYQLTHPWASVNGWLKASLYATISDNCYMTCPKSKLKAIVEYKDEKWIGKPKFELRGLIFTYDPNNDTINKLKNVPSADVLATIEGSWRTQIHVIYPDGRKRLLIDLTELEVMPKQVKPMEEQEEMESRRIWKDVTESILAKDFNQATKVKHALEEAQRAKAADRKSNGEEFVPQLFKLPVEGGKPELTEQAREILKSL
ncbi:oxysterol-binding protein [Umbelopsis sp. AD052]|nr:oxysterol-binding protein [Umbelopsis sp. AD052]